jgi:hypothetical protein
MKEISAYRILMIVAAMLPSPVFILEKEYSMTQREIDRAVAAQTGESVSEIRHLGFGIADPGMTEYDLEPCSRPPLVIDWDCVYPTDSGQ